MASNTKPWRWDFGGRYATAPQAIEYASTVLAVTVVDHNAAGWWPYSTTTAMAGVGVAAIVAVVIVLLHAAYRTVPGGTVTYRLVTVAGSAVWGMLLLRHDHWTVRLVLTYLAALVVGTVLLGFVGWLLDDRDTGDDPAEAEVPVLDPAAQKTIDDLAAMWERLILAKANVTCRVPAVEPYRTRTADGRQIGYTVQADTDGESWEIVAAAKKRFTAALRLGRGCSVDIRMGEHRAQAIIDVTEVNVLADEQPYPSEYGPLSIHGPLPCMTDGRGNPDGPILRERNLGIYGMGGSGKSNTAQVLGAGVARMTDTLLCDLDVTGARLSSGLLQPFLDGRTQMPAVFWSAADPDEAFLMLRALQRGWIARNNHYGRLKIEANDDKIPVSPLVPQFIVRCDEVTHYASRSGDQRLFALVQSLVNDARDPGFRAMFFALRGTEDIIAQSIQAQLHVAGVLKAATAREYVDAFGYNPAIDVNDAPYPGCIQIRMSEVEEPAPRHVWRLRPVQLGEIAIAVDGRQPLPDEITWLAMDGRDVDGQPFDDLLPGELDCCSTRWDRYFAKYNINRPVPDRCRRTTALAAAATPTATKGPTMTTQPSGGTPKSIDSALSDLDAALAAAQAEAARLNAIRDAEDGDAPAAPPVPADGEPVDPREWAAIEAAWVAPANDPRTMPAKPVDPRQEMLDIITRAGDDGIEAGTVWGELLRAGVQVGRPAVHDWLKREAAKNGTIEWRPNSEGDRKGRWYRVGGAS